MAFPQNITKNDLLKAMEKIDKEGIPNDADSQYYDVVYNEKRYPPKLIVSYANFFANGEILDRHTFSGGLDTPCFKLLEENGIIVEKKPETENPERKVWFVTQGSTLTPDKGMKFLFAPLKGNDDRSRFYWDNLLKVKTGDIIFNYSEGLKGVSIATSNGYAANNDDPNSQWGQKGYRVDLNFIPLSPIISREELANNRNELFSYLKNVKNKPFNNVGGVNQGYLYEFTKDAGKFLRELYGQKFGNKIIDDFFDNVQLPRILESTNSSRPPDRTMENFSYKMFFEKTKKSNFFINKSIALRFIASLLTKPFVILTGLSGSGKTKLAQAFAMWICEDENQYCIVPVGADWTNREPLLGFPNALQPDEYVKPENKVLDLIINALSNTDKPYFLILDEMNLSHVERYFADFLSVMESGGKICLHSGKDTLKAVPSEISLPKNLFIIGTVNIDETTYMFSPKVLDRANVIEFRVTAEEMNIYLDNNKILDLTSLESAGATMAESFVKIANDKTIAVTKVDELNKALMVFFTELKKTGAEFGYRSAVEILRFAAIINKIEPSWSVNEIIDAAIMQKLLPKVHGARRKLEPVLTALGNFCLENGANWDDYISSKTEIKFDNDPKIKYPISFEKIVRMFNNLITNGFTSYAEA